MDKNNVPTLKSFNETFFIEPMKDFKKFARDVGYNILREIAISAGPVGSDGRVIRSFIHFRAAYGIYIIEKIRSE